MKVLIVEDNTSNRILLKKILKKGNYTVDAVINGIEALEKLKSEKYDAVLTDWMMPEMDGLELIKRIRADVKPAPVILMITAIASKEAMTQALDAGADDFIAKPITSKDVLARVQSNLGIMGSDQVFDTEVDQSKYEPPKFSAITIAASTGGPQTLLKLFEKMSIYKNAAIFIVLHGPGWMLETFPDKLKLRTQMKVHLGKEGQKIKPGHIYLAPGDYHMLADHKTMSIVISDAPPENYVKPSADPLFRSVANMFGKKSVGIILTGMGHDGSIGAGFIKAAGGKVIAQDPNTAVLPAMPTAVIKLRLVDAVATVERIPAKIDEFLNN